MALAAIAPTAQARAHHTAKKASKHVTRRHRVCNRKRAKGRHGKVIVTCRMVTVRRTAAKKVAPAKKPVPTPSTPVVTSPPVSPAPVPSLPSEPIAPAGDLPFLHQQGDQVVDSAGNVVKLRGVDLGGWLNWEGWIFGGGYTGESAILSRLATLVGPDAAQQFQTQVEQLMIQESDIARIHSLGFNVVRVPFDYKLLEDPTDPGVYKASGWAILDNLMSWAQANHVYVILDMHAAPGGQAYGFVYDDPVGPLIWNSLPDQNDMIAMWKAIAARYADNSAIAGYDLLNEPWGSGPQLASLYARTIAAIRSVDTNHMVILEGAEDARNFSWATAPLDSNMMYSAHMYLWSQTNPQQALAADAQMAAAQHVPLWIGEFGENTPSGDASQVAMFENQPAVAGWSFWTWKQAYGWGMYTIPVSTAWKTLITWLCGSGTEPSVATAEQGMQDFLNGIQLSDEAPSAGTAGALALPAGAS